VEVAPGSEVSLLGATKNRIADFVHGSDGFGNTNQGVPKVRFCILLQGCLLQKSHHCYSKLFGGRIHEQKE
jgi:hypothetical protein